MNLPNGPYNPQTTEQELLNTWLTNGYYKPEYDPIQDRLMSLEEMKNDPREAWCLICPPPNAYARPHIGNISGYAYQDAMARYQRMKGKKVLVLPGKDHAGLEGEGVFVREVLEKQSRNKFDMTREDFYAEMMGFFMKNIDIARNDEKSIGLSADYDRDTFTLDPDVVKTVLDTFVEMYNAGMIYKGVRIVNWDPKARSAVADNQTEYKDSVSSFYYFKYSFDQPDTKALNLKHKFMNETVKFKFERNKTKDEKTTLPFAFGLMDDIEVLGIGFDDAVKGQVLEGKAIGVLMRINAVPRLIVVNNNVDNLESQLQEVFLFESKYYAGSHVIEFEKYPEDKFYTNGFIIGTVRPETIFADTAIACDPKDDRYKEFVGKQIEVEFLGKKKKLHFISDFAVDKDFGTGLLKITPAHSVEDWEIAQRHSKECLPAIQVINYDLRLNHLCAKYEGLRINEARVRIEEDMINHGNLIFVDRNYTNRIKIAERTKAPIEPLLSSQWYLKYDGIKEAALKMVEEGRVTIHPNNMVQKFKYWMENLRDWAISRSLWWGYRLPVWYHGQIKEEIDNEGQVKELIKLPKILSKEIELAKPEDAEAIWEIEVEGWEDNFVNGELTLERIRNEFGFRKDNKEEIEIIQNSIQDHSRIYLVAKKGGKIVGWANIENINNKETKWTNIYVKRDFRGQGIGTLLMNNLFRLYPQYELHLAVPAHSNVVKFYKNLRFTEYSRNSENEYKLPIIQMKREGDSNEWVNLEYNNPDHLRVQRECPGEGWIQDESVLDTWFSSGQWIYATLSKHNLMDTFFPTNVLVSAHDILENWDSRMMMFTYFKHKTHPFDHLFLTGLVLGTDGQKMSKSKGNIIDMDKVREAYGTDSIRMTYFYQNSAGGSYVVSEPKLKNFKNFNNKIWNASRFVMMNLEGLENTQVYALTASDLRLENSKEIFDHINKLKEKITKNIDEFEFGYATESLYDEFWHTFCDIQLENSKKFIYTQKDKETGIVLSQPDIEEKEETQRVLLYTLKNYLKMLHPFIPFITQRIWDELPKEAGDHKVLMYSCW